MGILRLQKALQRLDKRCKTFDNQLAALAAKLELTTYDVQLMQIKRSNNTHHDRNTGPLQS